MRQPTLLSGILYICLGVIFTFFAIQNINQNGEWGIFTYLLILLATFDLGSGIRMLSSYFKRKK